MPRNSEIMEGFTEKKGYITEVFSSIQGEGPYVGYRQIFVRFYGCHRNCWYCDTPETVTARHDRGYRPASFRVGTAAGLADSRRLTNPVSVETVVELVESLDQPASTHRSVAVTGGEPLLQVLFLERLFPVLRDLGYTIYLETTGDLPAALGRVGELCDVIAMDVKMPSATKEAARWDLHRDFLALARRQKGDLFVKAVVGASTEHQEIVRLAAIVSTVDPAIPLILQPVTPVESIDASASPEQLLAWQRKLSASLENVRVIPQIHKSIGME